MAEARPAIVLASASPRRRALLAEAGVDFEVLPADVDETLAAGTVPESGAVLLASRKARAVAARIAPLVNRYVLAADTVVAVDTSRGVTLLGKPESPAEARAMLAALSGTRHRVVTGVCALRAHDRREEAAFERTFVQMRVIEPAEIEAYVASGEWRDKAGGYAIQETADQFVLALAEGGFDNVVGLPVQLALELLRRIGAPCPVAKGGLSSSAQTRAEKPRSP